jgi:magnesium chelatase family protein
MNNNHKTVNYFDEVIFMAVKIISASFRGIEGKLIDVEVDLVRGLPCFNIVGLADTSVKEAKERVRSAIVNSGYEFPVCRIVVNLAPADLRKAGTHFDLPIAVGILAASGQIRLGACSRHVFIGELSLSGALNRITGGLPIIMEGMRNGIVNFVVPEANALECSFVKGSRVFAFKSLTQAAAFVRNREAAPFERGSLGLTFQPARLQADFEDVMGHESSKRAIEVAAAGGHNLLFTGPPGSGKTMLAERIPAILPALTYRESLDVTRIYSVSGKTQGAGLITERPFRAPHHTSTAVSLVGGGSSLMPGEVSLAHHGVLFLDEILEFRKRVLDILRQPLEERKISISRSTGTVVYPANIMLVGAMNPCPCGYHGSSRECTCTDFEKRQYLSRLSGPLIDRIDMFAYVNSVPYNEIKRSEKPEASSAVKKRVEAAREIQNRRFEGTGIFLNSQMTPKMLKEHCALSMEAAKLLEKVYERHHLSTRSYSRILKVARTISDLECRSGISTADVIEALQYKLQGDGNFG